MRVVPGASARFGAFLARGVVMMPSYVNIGAYVDSGTMVDTWATVGSCAQIGKNVHLSGGVGIGGVLEPPQAVPVVVEDDCFIGSRCMIVDGAWVKHGRQARRRARRHVDHARHRGRDRQRAARGASSPSDAVVISGHAPEGVRGRHVRPAVRARSCATSPRARATTSCSSTRSCESTASFRDPRSPRADRGALRDPVGERRPKPRSPTSSRRACARAARRCAIERIGANVVARTELGPRPRASCSAAISTPCPRTATRRRAATATCCTVSAPPT